MNKNDIKKVCIIDGQGGGIGSAVIKRIKERYGETIEVIALGTNAIATAQMLKARANKGASGSNAIVQTVKKADVIIGPLGIIMAHAMMGEVTPEMAEAVCLSEAKKVLLPLTQENIAIVGVAGLPLPLLVDELIESHLSFLDEE
jgi:NAD(P)-dependent dehydrogenase (short-subunit alcohol dehydrogenase family)